MSQLVLEKELFASQEDSRVRTLARARTLTVLRRLDPDRKGLVVQFLYECELIEPSHPVGVPIIALKDAYLRDADLSNVYLQFVDLRSADLSGADLRDAALPGCQLSSAKLREADLGGANLVDNDLSHADLSNANRSRTNLSGAKVTEAQLGTSESLEGATMPGGSKHP